ncbi:MAG: cation-translocating P-type ATPase [Acidobacteria bacterium]|nr:cation-translocating P-type ATPase [Acidobacteriota bacterium]
MGLLERAFSELPGWLAFVLVGIGGYPIFRGLLRDLPRGRITARAVMALGLGAALAVGEYSAAVVIVFFMRAGEYIESLTVNRSRAAIRALTEAAPETATVRRNGQEEIVRATDVLPGDLVIVRPGRRIPVDGVVVAGQSEVNQAPITGESNPATKKVGDKVFAASVNQIGYLEIRAEQVGSDTTFGRILHLVEQAQASKAPVQRLADRFSAYFIPIVLLAAGFTWLTTGKVMNAVAVLVVACACAIAIATPMAVAAAVGAGARRGILIKGGAYLEALARVDTLLVDKTGTLTFGAPAVTDVLPLNGWKQESILRLAAAVERYSEHPLAKAVVASAENAGGLPEGQDFQVVAGRGVSGRVEGRLVRVGSAEWAAASAETERLAAVFQEQGKTAVFIGVDGEVVGLVATADKVRPELGQAFGELRQLGISRILMVTGDRERVASNLARSLGIEYVAEALPDDKINLVLKLQREGRRVAMVGDGINDAPALAAADVGIAMGAAGTAAAIEAADIALMTDDWAQVPTAVRLARRTFRTIQQNLLLTAAYNALGIALAWIGVLPPIAGAAAQSLPDVAILLNSARLLRS